MVMNHHIQSGLVRPITAKVLVEVRLPSSNPPRHDLILKNQERHHPHSIYPVSETGCRVDVLH